MKEDLSIGVVIGVVLSLLAGSVWLGILAFQECHRVHPWWYCLMGR